MLLKITPDIFEKFPEVIIGVVIAHGINNVGEDAEVMRLLRAEESRVSVELSNTPINEHPYIAVWRDAYRKFGAKPQKHASSIENLVRRVTKAQAIPHINKLVDLYNTISLRFILPVGGEDLDKIEGDVLLTSAGSEEAPVRLLGESEDRAPYLNEVIYKDDAGAICRRWNWKEADRTKLTQETKNAFLVIEGLPPVTIEIIETAITELASLVRKHCGGAVTTVILDRDNAEVDLTGGL